MHLISQTPLIAQLVSDAERLQHQYEFLSYGLTAAWVILAIYVLMMVARERKLKREIASLRAMLEEKTEPRRKKACKNRWQGKRLPPYHWQRVHQLGYARDSFPLEKTGQFPGDAHRRARVPEVGRAHLNGAGPGDQELGGIQAGRIPPRPMTGIFTARAAW